jgi:hypothetical protein
MAAQPERRTAERRQADRRKAKTLDLGADAIGYRIEARDGYVGRAVDYCVEEESWVVTGLIAKTRWMLGSKRVFVPLSAIRRIDPREKTIYVTPTREDVRRGSRRTAR